LDSGSQFQNAKLSAAPARCYFLIFSFVIISLSTSSANAQWEPMNPVTTVHQEKDAVVFSLQTGTLKIQVLLDSVLRILYSFTGNFPERRELRGYDRKRGRRAPFTVQSTDDDTTITTATLKVVVSRKDRRDYLQRSGRPQADPGRHAKTDAGEGEREGHLHAESFFNIYGTREGLYGLGSTRLVCGTIGRRIGGYFQDNTNIARASLVSSNGYGIFWKMISRSRLQQVCELHVCQLGVATFVDYYFFYGPES